jgi:hypothetical protein
MVLDCLKWNIHPDKMEACAASAQGAIQRTLATDITAELWGPSPIVPRPIRPGG